MNSKKSKDADLEKKRNIFFYLGFAAALCFSWVALEWTSVTYGGRELRAALPGELLEPEELPFVKLEKPKPKEQPKQKVRFIVEPNPQPEPDPGPEPDPNPDPFVDLELEIIDLGWDDPDPKDEDPWISVEIMPHFLDCENVLDRTEQQKCTEREIIRLVQSRVKYPRILVDTRVEGTVYASFVIGVDGEISDITIQRSPNERFNATVIAAIESLPTFQPGMQQGRKVPVIMNIPVKFVVKN